MLTVTTGQNTLKVSSGNNSIILTKNENGQLEVLHNVEHARFSKNYLTVGLRLKKLVNLQPKKKAFRDRFLGVAKDLKEKEFTDIKKLELFLGEKLVELSMPKEIVEMA